MFIKPSSGMTVGLSRWIWKAFWFAVFGVVLSVLAITRPPVRTGDAHEYILMQEALYRHASPEIRFEDVVEVEQLTSRSEGVRMAEVAAGLKSVIRRHGYPGAPGFLGNSAGSYYSIHFFLYPLLSIPARVVLESAGLDPLRSFQLTNAIFILAALGYILLSSKLLHAERWWASVLFLLGGTTYYLFWIHPEVFTASLLLVSIVSWIDRRPLVSVVCASLASMQNPPVAFIIPVVLAWHLFDDGAGFRPGLRFAVGQLLNEPSRILALLAASSLALLPTLFYSLTLGMANPIAAVCKSDTAFITLPRFLSLWLDLNQGTVLGEAGLFFGFAALPILLLRWRQETQGPAVAQAFALIALAGSMTLPCLTTLNWNQGCSVFIRYGSWLSMPLIVAFVLLIRSIRKDVRGVLALLVAAVQLGIVVNNGIWGKGSPVVFTDVSKAVMLRFPGWYNPEPEIFAERSIGMEFIDFVESGREGVYEFGTDEAASKLLVPKSRMSDSMLTAGPLALCPVGPFSRVDAGFDMTYLNGRFEKTLLTKIAGDVAVPFNSDAVLWRGWSGPEAQWRWSEGKSCRVLFSTDSSELAGAGRLEFALSPLEGKAQRLEVLINGRRRFAGVVKDESVVSVPFSTGDIRLGGMNTVELKTPDARCPSGGHDRRRLAFSLKWFCLSGSGND